MSNGKCTPEPIMYAADEYKNCMDDIIAGGLMSTPQQNDKESRADVYSWARGKKSVFLKHECSCHANIPWNLGVTE